MNNIHPTAIIHEKAKISETAKICAYSIIDEYVEIGKNTHIHSHVNITGRTKIGDNNEIFPFASLGTVPQDLKFEGEHAKLVIGNNNIIREHVTMNIGTKGGAMQTIIGDNCLFMVASHIAHDCIIGNNVILANNATLAGHVEIGDNVIIGGLAAVHQFVRIGNNAIIGGMSGVAADVIPFSSVSGERAFLAGLNLIGMKRKNIARESINATRAFYKELFTDGTTLKGQAEKLSSKYSAISEIMQIINFLKNDSSRSFCTPKAL